MTTPSADKTHLLRYGYAPGNYMGRCNTCKQIVTDIDKRAIACLPCAEFKFALDESLRKAIQESKSIDSEIAQAIHGSMWDLYGNENDNS